MNSDKQIEPSKLTKVLVKKIHCGRKEDSQFWQSEFADQDIAIEIPKPEKSTFFRNAFLLPVSTLLLLVVLIYTAVCLKPELFPFLDRHKIYAYLSNFFHYTPGKTSEPNPIYPMPVPRVDVPQQPVQPYNQPKKTTPPAKIEKYIYRVEFWSGKTMEAKNVSVDKNIVTLFIDKGYTVKMNKSDIKSVKREKL